MDMCFLLVCVWSKTELCGYFHCFVKGLGDAKSDVSRTWETLLLDHVEAWPSYLAAFGRQKHAMLTGFGDQTVRSDRAGAAE